MGKWEHHRTQVGLGLKQSSLGGTFYPNVSKTHKYLQKINSASWSTGEDRVVLAVGELERVPALTVTSPVRCSLLFLIMKGGLFFCYPVTSLAIFRCSVDYGVS